MKNSNERLAQATKILQTQEHSLRGKAITNISEEVKKGILENTTHFIEGIKNIKIPEFDPSYDNVIVVGNTTDGKSTLVNYLLGNKLEINPIIKKGESLEQRQILITTKGIGPNIGDSTISETSIIQVWQDSKNKINYFDCPGFKDSRGDFYRIANKEMIQLLTTKLTHIKFLFLINQNIFNKDTISINLSNIIETTKNFFDSFDKVKELSSSISFVVTKGIMYEEDEEGRQVPKQPDVDYYLKKFQDNLENLRTIEQENKLRNDNHEDCKAFSELFVDTKVKIGVFPKFFKKGEVSLQKNDNILTIIQNLTPTNQTNIFTTFYDSRDYDIKLEWITKFYQEYNKELIHNIQTEIKSELDIRLHDANLFGTLVEYLKGQKIALGDMVKSIIATNTKEASLNAFISGLKGLSNKACIEISDVINEITTSLLFFSRYSNIIPDFNDLEHNIKQLENIYEKLLPDKHRYKKDQGVFEIYDPISSMSQINEKYNKYKEKYDLKLIKSISYLFVMDQDCQIPGLNLAISATRWNIPEQKIINLSYNPIPNVTSGTLIVLPAGDINYSSSKEDTDVPTGLNGGNFYGYAKQVTNSLLTVNVSGGKGADRGFDMAVFDKKKQDLKKTIGDLEYDLKKIEVFEQFENVYRGDKENLTAASNEILTTMNQLITKIKEHDSKVERIEKILGDALLPEGDRTKNQQERERLITDKRKLTSKLSQNESKLSEINKSLQNIDKYEQLKAIETQWKIAEENQKEYKALEKKLNKAESKLQILKDYYSKTESISSLQISEQEIVPRMQEINKLEEAAKQLLQNDLLQIDEYRTKANNITKALNTIFENLNNLTTAIGLNSLKTRLDNTQEKVTYLKQQISNLKNALPNQELENAISKNFNLVVNNGQEPFAYEINAKDLITKETTKEFLAKSLNIKKTELKNCNYMFNNFKDQITKFNITNEKYENAMKKLEKAKVEFSNEYYKQQKFIKNKEILEKFKEQINNLKETLEDKHEKEKNFENVVAQKDLNLDDSKEIFKAKTAGGRLLSTVQDKSIFVKHAEQSKIKLQNATYNEYEQDKKKLITLKRLIQEYLNHKVQLKLLETKKQINEIISKNNISTAVYTLNGDEQIISKNKYNTLNELKRFTQDGLWLKKFLTSFFVANPTEDKILDIVVQLYNKLDEGTKGKEAYYTTLQNRKNYAEIYHEKIQKAHEELDASISKFQAIKVSYNEWKENYTDSSNLKKLFDLYAVIENTEQEIQTINNEQGKIAKKLLLNDLNLESRIRVKWEDRDTLEKLKYILKELFIFNTQFYEHYKLVGTDGENGGDSGHCKLISKSLPIEENIIKEGGCGGKNAFLLEGIYVNEYSFPLLRGIKEQNVIKEKSDTAISPIMVVNGIGFGLNKYLTGITKTEGLKYVTTAGIQVTSEILENYVMQGAVQKTAVQGVTQLGAESTLATILAMPGIGWIINGGLLAGQCILSPIVAILSRNWTDGPYQVDNGYAPAGSIKTAFDPKYIDEQQIQESYINYLQQLREVGAFSFSGTSDLSIREELGLTGVSSDNEFSFNQ